MSCMVDGRSDSPIMVVAMAPGNEELKLGSPLVGPTGNLFWSQAGKVGGFTRADCYLINTIGEWPTGPNGNPSLEQYEKYWEQFDEAVGAFTGHVVICLGGAAFWRYTGIGKPPAAPIETWRGYLVKPHHVQPIMRRVDVMSTYKTSRKLPDGTWKYRKGDPKVERKRRAFAPVIGPNVSVILPMLHPSNILKSGFQTLPALVADVRRAGRALRGELDERPVRYITYAVYEASPERVVLDIETTGKDGPINRIAITTDRNNITMPWGADAAQLTRSYFDDPKVTKVVWNVGFDKPRLRDALRTRGQGPWRDGMLAAHMLQPDLFKGLKKVTPLLQDLERWDHKSDADPEWYNACDGQYTLRNDELLCADLRRTGQYELFTQTIMPATDTLMDMTSRGLWMDPARRQGWLSELEQRIGQLDYKWAALTAGVNPLSPKQVEVFLREKLKLPISYNKYGGVTTDAGSLRELLLDQHTTAHARQCIETLLALRDATKMRKTYAMQPVDDDGAVHASFLPATKDQDTLGRGLAGTWRITSRDPNLQNQPKIARKLFAARPGYEFVEFDFEQLEARILAALSGDPALQAALEEGLHSANMRILNVDRVRAKNGFYGWMNFAGQRVLRRTFVAHGYDIPESECAALLTRCDQAYPVAAAYRRSLVRQAEQTYSITNPFKLRRYFYGASRNAPAAVSTMMQGTGAIMTWKILPPLDEAMTALEARLLLLVHDSFLVESPLGRRAELCDRARAVAEQEFPEVGPGFRVPITFKVGPNWGELEDYHV